jgi:putative ABC transport system ATP-binding protein
MHLLGLLDRPSAGRYWPGEDVAGLDDDRPSELRNRLIGFLFQTFYLVPYLTALENVVLPGLYSLGVGPPSAARAEELLAGGFGRSPPLRPPALRRLSKRCPGPRPGQRPALLADEPTGQLTGDQQKSWS